MGLGTAVSLGGKTPQCPEWVISVDQRRMEDGVYFKYRELITCILFFYIK
jgi:hypothetical protein